MNRPGPCGLAIALGLAGASLAEPAGGAVTVAVAANLRATFEAGLQAMRTVHPELTVKATYGSTGAFHAQILQGAPFDMLLAADDVTPRKLVDEGLAAGEAFAYAHGRLALWVPQDSPVPLETLGMGAVLHPSVRYLAAANPRVAPYGKAAVAALQALGLYEKVKPRLVPGNDIAQTAQFVQTGTCQIGLVAYSQVLGPELGGQGRHLEVPADKYPPIRQAGVVLKHGKNPRGAAALRDFVVGPRFRQLLERFGYGLP